MPVQELAADDDDALVAGAKAGDRAALDALVHRYYERVYRIALRLTGHEQDAEDVLQNTFLSVVRALSEFRGDARFSTWLYRIATNEALMHQRSAKHRQTDSLDDLLPQFTSDGTHQRLDVDYSEAADVESIIDRDDLAEAIRDAVARLPEMYRAAFVLCDLEEMSAVEAANVLSIKPATVRQRVHRARLMLRGYLGQLARSECS